MIQPDPIIDLSIGYWKSRAFLAAVHLGVFKHCGTEGLPFSLLSDMVGVQPEKLKPLVGAMVEMGLLEIHSMTGDVCPTALAHTYLNPHSPACMDTSVEYAREMYASWDQLESRLKEPQRPNPTPSKQDTPTFLAGMHNRSKMLSHVLMPLLKIGAKDRVLDIAAGAGTWSHLLQKEKGVCDLTLVEQPEICEEMKVFIEDKGLLGAKFIASDYHLAFTQERFDQVLFFGALHQEPQDELESCLLHLWDRVDGGGRLWILDIFVAENQSRLFAHLFGLNMLLRSEGSVFELQQLEKALDILPNKQKFETHPIPGSLPYYLIEIEKN